MKIDKKYLHSRMVNFSHCLYFANFKLGITFLIIKSLIFNDKLTFIVLYKKRRTVGKCTLVQWQPFNVILLGQRETNNTSQMITITFI
jgi:hypothetical protein